MNYRARELVLATTILSLIAYIAYTAGDTCNPQRERDWIGSLMCGAIIWFSAVVVLEAIWDGIKMWLIGGRPA